MTTSARPTQCFLRADVVIGPYGSVRNCLLNRNLKNNFQLSTFNFQFAKVDLQAVISYL